MQIFWHQIEIGVGGFPVYSVAQEARSSLEVNMQEEKMATCYVLPGE
jgi:hypothetical protein